MSRHQARRAAMQMVYETILGGEGGDDTLLGLIAYPAEGEELAYIDTLLKGVRAEADQLDQQIAKRSPSFALDRIPVVVRSVLRVALYELAHEPDLAEAVVIDEAVEMTKRYATREDARFVNAVLGSVVRDRQTP